MYEDDTPPAERRAQALSLDRDLLRELLGQEELRDLIDPGALEDVEGYLRGDPRSPDELHDVLDVEVICELVNLQQNLQKFSSIRSTRGIIAIC